VKRGEGRQDWDVKISLIERVKIRAGGGALAAARKALAETGEQAMWWLPAQLNLMAAGEPAPEGFRRRWEELRRTQADLSRQDRSLAVVALGEDAHLPFGLGEAGDLMNRQGVEGTGSCRSFQDRFYPRHLPWRRCTTKAWMSARRLC